MTVAADPVENDPRHLDLGAVFGEALEHGGRRFCLGAGIDDQHHRPAGQAGQVGG